MELPAAQGTLEERHYRRKRRETFWPTAIEGRTNCDIETRIELSNRLGHIETEAIGAVQGIVTATANMLSMAGLVAALAEARLIDPKKVADWIDTMASVRWLGQRHSPTVHEGLKAQLDSLSLMLRAMATVPTGTGRG